MVVFMQRQTRWNVLEVDHLFKVEINEKEIYVLPKEDKDKLNPNWGTN